MKGLQPLFTFDYKQLTITKQSPPSIYTIFDFCTFVYFFYSLIFYYIVFICQQLKYYYETTILALCLVNGSIKNNALQCTRELFLKKGS